MAAATPWASTSAAAATASSSVVRAMSVVRVVTFWEWRWWGTVSVRTWVRTLREGRWWATRLGGASLVVF